MPIVLKRTRNPNERVSECGRVVVQMLREKEERVFKWSFDFPPFMGTKFDFIAYNRPSPHPWYDKKSRAKKSRAKSRVRARMLFDALDDGLGAEVGLMRKPRNLKTYSRVKHPKPDAGASRHNLRDALENRLAHSTWLGTPETCLKMLHPSKTLKTATADELFETLYAVAWCQSCGRRLNEWQGMSTEAAA